MRWLKEINELEYYLRKVVLFLVGSIFQVCPKGDHRPKPVSAHLQEKPHEILYSVSVSG